MQGVRKKFTIRHWDGEEKPAHTNDEVRNHERGRKEADPLGSSGPQASGDPFRSHGKPDSQRIPIGKRNGGKQCLQKTDVKTPLSKHCLQK